MKKITGLSELEVKERQQRGATNYFEDHSSKTYQQIIKDNIFTLFNFINLILAILVLITGKFENLLFIGIVFWNIIIGIVQEIRSKKELDKLQLLNADKIDVIRDEKIVQIHSDDLVIDDVYIIKSGQQVPCDSIVINGNIEVNEALITGESDNCLKQINDHLCSGSVIVSGKAYLKAEAVGKDCYINKILAQIKVKNKYNSQLMNNINSILKLISIIIVPIGICLFCKQYFISQVNFNDAIIGTVAALVGMIPEGVILLTTVALALGTIRLAKKNVLVQELYAIEGLARIDTLCCDKTGTITKGNMEIAEIITYQNYQKNDIKNILKIMFDALEDDNNTAQAIRSYVKTQEINNPYQIEKVLPFSSDRKASAVSYNHQTYIIGAYNFILDNIDSNIKAQIENFSSQSKRVLVLCQSDMPLEENLKAMDKQLIAIIVLSDPIKPSASSTINYFYQQGVDVKIISGDDVNTVRAIAQTINLKNYDKYIDATSLETQSDIDHAVLNYNVFGRVTPKQKEMMIMSLKKQHKTPAMVGDGVNDVLSLKKADCSIAMSSGSDAAKNIANLVLLDNDFDKLPLIVNEGRRVINNIKRSTTLFLTKTVFSIILAILTIFFIKQYPLQPIQLSIISSLTIGLPAFLLTYEPNNNKITKEFIGFVLKYAIPGGLSAAILIILIEFILKTTMPSISLISLQTISMVVLASCIFCVLLKISLPFNKYRFTIFIAFSILFYLLIILVPKTKHFYNIIGTITLWQWLILIAIICLIYPLQSIGNKLMCKILQRKG